MRATEDVSMYGTRDAALNWSKEHGDTLKQSGFIRGRNNPCLFQNKELNVSIMVHGDDFIAVGSEKKLKTTRAILENKCKIKVEVLGDKRDQTKELRIFNKVVRLTNEGVELEADPRHVEFLAKSLNLENCKAVVMPGVKLPFDDNVKPSDDPMDDAIIDHKVSQVVRTPKITFDLNPVVHRVPSQCDTYGSHPCSFDLTIKGSC